MALYRLVPTSLGDPVQPGRYMIDPGNGSPRLTFTVESEIPRSTFLDRFAARVGLADEKAEEILAERVA